MSTILILGERPIAFEKVKADTILLAIKALYLFQNIFDDRIKIIPLENEKQMPAEETWKLLDRINSLLKKAVGSERSWVYEAGYHIEGSGLAQNCSDILSGMEVVEQLFKQYTIDEIILYPTVENLIECMLVEEIAHKKRIKLRRYYGGINNYLITKNFGVVFWLKCIRARLGRRKKYAELLKKAAKDTVKEKQEYQLGMIHTTNSKKGISWKSTWVYGLKEEFETYKLLCLNAKQAADHFRSQGVATDNMEEWLTKETVKDREREYRGLIKKSLRLIKKEFEFYYRDMDISKTIQYFISMHLLQDVPRTLEIDSICFDYFRKNSYSVISSQGDSNFVETRAMYYNTRDVQTKLFRREGLMIFNVPRYEPYENMISIRFFCKGSKRYEELIRQGWRGKAYFIGDTQYIPKFAEQYKKRQEHNRVREKLSVLWAPSYIVRGYTTYNTFQSNNNRLLQKFSEMQWKLYVKFHPNQQESQIRQLYEQCSDCESIQFVDKKESINDWIEKADVIITDKSLLVFDSITAGKPVMVLCSPLHYSLMGIHEKGVRIYQSMEKLFEELKHIENDREYFEQWRKETVNMQDNYFKSFMKDSDALKDMADALKGECRI